MRQKLAGRCTRLNNFAEHFFRKTEFVDNLPGPVSFLSVKKLGGGSDGVFGLLCTGEEILQKIGYKEQVFSVLELIRIFNKREELIKSIYVEELRSGNTVKILFGDNRKQLIHKLLGKPGITVVIRVSDKLSLIVEQTVVNAPGVN